MRGERGTGAERAEAQRQQGRDVDLRDACGGDLQRGEVAAVDDVQVAGVLPRAVVLQQQRRREQFLVLARGGGAQHLPVEAGGELPELLRLEGLAAETAQQVGDGLHRLQPLAAYVADEDAGAERGVQGLDEVAAYAGVRGGGPVQAREVQPAQVLGYGVQHGVLQGARGLAHPGQPVALFPP